MRLETVPINFAAGGHRQQDRRHAGDLAIADGLRSGRQFGQSGCVHARIVTPPNPRVLEIRVKPRLCNSGKTPRITL